MKSKFSLLLICGFFTILFSCKNETPIDDLEVVSPKVATVNLSNFKVTLNVVVKKDDDFALFYTIDGSTDFKIAPIWHAVKGSSDAQEIKYELPQTVLPTELRLDFGLKQEQEDIVLKSVVLEYKDKKREISGAELANFFRADENKCSFDGTTIKAVVKGGVKESPSLYPQESNLGPELKKLVN
ncbi:hypothetical protein [Flavobacterium sp.]|uniref:hypothetical protein n=1 Tax=Flavobacterium sp. TaxID=239 RepID=UPI00286A908C|nr:hypothetical protein [Flavobacterium sp.]